MTIDLNPDRAGRCYDSSHETHGLVGNTPIIATSFTDALIRLVNNKGGYWYWIRDDFISLRDAFDDV